MDNYTLSILGVMLQIFISALIVGYIIAKIIESKIKAISISKCDKYEDGLRMRWTNSSLRNLYAKKYNTETKPSETDILKMFEDMGAKITIYDKNNIVIPWTYILKWEHFIVDDDNLQNGWLILNIVNEENKINMLIGSDYQLDPVYMAVNKYIPEKEDVNKTTEKEIIEAQ